MERQAAHAQAEIAGAARQRQQRLRVAAELSRQIGHRARAAEGDTQQQFGLVGPGQELAQLVRVVGDENADAALQRGADVDVALDRMGVDAARGINPHAGDELDLAGGRQIEETALLEYGLHDGRMGQRLQRVVQVDARQGVMQTAVLATHPFAVDDQQRRAELADEPADLARLERIDVRRLAGRTHRCGPVFPDVCDQRNVAAARASRSRTASHSLDAGTASARIREAPCLSRLRS